MAARHIPLGQPVHELERQGIRFLVENLPDGWTVYSNAFLVERTGVSHELDAVVLAPHGLYVVELKAYRNRVTGNDYDWFVPDAVRSPVVVNRKTAQALRQALRHQSLDAGRVWVDHLVFLSHTDDVDLRGAMSQLHVHTRRTILGALADVQGYQRRAVGGAPAPDKHTSEKLEELLGGGDRDRRAPRQIAQWKIQGVHDTTDRYVEYRAEHSLQPGLKRILRVYPLTGPNAERLRERCQWEAQVLARVARHESILDADPLFTTEEGLCLPFEDFNGVTLHSWLERHAVNLTGTPGLKARVDLWLLVARAIAFVHEQGVVHRLLRDDAVLVPNVARPGELRVTGFDLAKQLTSGQTIAWSTADERLKTAAPELLRKGFSSANEATDQWGLGVLLGQLFKGRRLFESTEDFVRNGAPSLRALRSGVPSRLDDAFQRMVLERSAERFGSVREAIDAVTEAIELRASRVASTLIPEDLPPGTSLGGNEYEVLEKLGAGGLATVYEARHLVSGTKRALKVARQTDAAEQALRDESAILDTLHHPQIVRGRDISKSLVPDRLTFVMERVKGLPLSRWLKQGTSTSTQQLRHMADTFLSALEYLEEKGITHKDLKPDNLMASEAGITVIDFSLAGRAADDLAIGTAAWRDPRLQRWDHEADRYAAALCLFELFTGRHPFDGRPPAPDDAPTIRPEEFDSPALRRFFVQALSPSRESRFPSARAMRAFFTTALSGPVAAPAEPERSPEPAPTADAPLAASGLSGTAVAVLQRAGVMTQGDLLRLTDAQLSAISGLGKKKHEEVVAFRDSLRARGVPATRAPSRAARPLMESLAGDATPVQQLGLKSRVTEALVRAGLVQVGQVAMSLRVDLLALEGFGQQTVEAIATALIDFENRRPALEGAPQTLDQLLQRATQRLEVAQVQVLTLRYGLRGPPLPQGEVAAQLGKGQSDVSRLELSALETIDRRMLQEPLECIETALAQVGGVDTVESVVQALTSRWPVNEGLRPEGVLLLIQRLHQTRFHFHSGHEGEDSERFLRHHTLDGEALGRFLQLARELASRFPNEDAEATRRALRAALPEYELDPLALATRLEQDLRCTDTEQLFETPVHVREAVAFVLGRERLPVRLDALVERVRRAFGEGSLEVNEILAADAVAQLPTYRLVDGEVNLALASLRPTASEAQRSEIPEALRVAARSPDEVAREKLLTLRNRAAYRLVVSPPELHREVGRGVASVLGVPFVSFEEALLQHSEADFENLEKGERYSAMRHLLTQAAEQVFDALVREHTGPGRTFVLGDTGSWGVCGALHLPRRLYDLTTERDLGLCVLVVPGVYRSQRVQFNESQSPVFGLAEHIFPLEKPWTTLSARP